MEFNRNECRVVLFQIVQMVLVHTEPRKDFKRENFKNLLRQNAKGLKLRYWVCSIV